MLVTDEMLLEAGRRAYSRAVPVLQHAHRAADAADQSEWFMAQVAEPERRWSRRLIVQLGRLAGYDARASFRAMQVVD